MARGRGQEDTSGQTPPTRGIVRDPAIGDIDINLQPMGETQPNWWTPPDAYQRAANQFAQLADIDRVAAHRALKHSFKTYQERLDWLNPGLDALVDPEDTVVGMKAAAAALQSSIEANEKIAIFGDYDPDGTTGVTAFREALLTYTDEDNLIIDFADAKRGFGLTNEFVNKAHEAGAKILVTIDCGSTQTSQVQLAQDLGMKVIIVDHHHVDHDNPANFHLNPLLYVSDDDPDPTNTGAQLAWKLGLALHEHNGNGRNSDTGKAYTGQPMWLAGFGCIADMGDVLDTENRAFSWYPINQLGENAVPIGVKMLADRLGEGPEDIVYSVSENNQVATTDGHANIAPKIPSEDKQSRNVPGTDSEEKKPWPIPGTLIMTSACLNLPKRSTLVDAADTAALMAAKTEEEAQPYVDKLVKAYELARPKRKEMTELAIKQIKDRKKGGFTSFAVIDDFEEYAGYTGVVASSVSRSTGKPAIIFANKGEDEYGQTVYKFSIRNSVNNKHRVGELIESDTMREAVSLKALDESGETVVKSSMGGHSNVVSGACTKENIIKVRKAFEAWATKKAGSSGKGWEKRKGSGPEAYVVERKVDPQRLPKIEKDCARLAPYSGNQSHYEAQISMMGSIDKPVQDEDGYWRSIITFDNGLRREAIMGKDRGPELPVDERVEWVLTISNGPYYLNKYHKAEPITTKKSGNSWFTF